ncbi:TonB-dependent hemoglobin/transferrin/lactoferrin family receptor [Phytopseudomonas dryadis]|nr:TonB-dependent hemoglobin/transferrin/lactoferrin family receptor [Pseudomonas dryadis]
MSHQVARTPRARRSVRLAGSLVVGATLAFSGAAWAQQAASSAAQASASTEQVDFDIPAQPLGSAVIAFAEQAGIQVFFDSGKLAGLQSRELKGLHSPQQGLGLLLSGLPVSYSFTGERRVNVERVAQVGGTVEIAATQVQADRVDDWVYQAPRSVSVITREEIDKRPPRHAADMLLETPGVSSAVNRHDPGLSVNIRGMQDFGRVNTMIDGMRQNHVESGHQQRNGQIYVDSELLSSIEIERGPNSGIYGANAIAGSANFKTLDYADIILPGQDHGVRLRGSTGVGGRGNGVNFVGSAAVAGRIGENIELLGAYSKKSLGDYDIGRRGQDERTLLFDGSDAIGNIKSTRFSNQQQESWLAKGKFSFSDQTFQFSYIGTEISYSNVSDWSENSHSDSGGWSKSGEAEATSDSFALDYTYSPDSPWVDLSAKLYFVTTENKRLNEPEPNAAADMAWDYGLCTTDPVPASWVANCQAGLRSATYTQTDTLGIQLSNTSYLYVGDSGELSANYGFEWFQDEAKPKNVASRDGRTTSYFSSLSNSNLNPQGRRDVTSVFSSLTFENESYTVQGGVRYDHYHLRGDTVVPRAHEVYESRLEKFTRAFSSSLVSAQAQCDRGIQTGCNNAIQYSNMLADPEGYRPDIYNRALYAPSWTSGTEMAEESVDKSAGKFSPFFSLAYRPTDWAELFSNWGKGWRPPAITETLFEGGHPGDSSSTMYPNPLAEPERSESWEVGVNFLKENLFQSSDRFAAKVSYFDTRVDNYLFTALHNVTPGTIGTSNGLGNVAFVNNLERTKFRGLELESTYDAGRWYAGLNYTKMIGQNDFCKKNYWLGYQLKQFDFPNEDGSYSSQHQQAIAEGYSSFEEKMNAMVRCGDNSIAGMNSARLYPPDRGSAHVGIRLFERSLDMGVRVNRSEANGPKEWEGVSQWESYTTWDFFSVYKVTRNMSLNFSVENIRDRNYISGYSDIFSRTYAPGRTVQAGVELKF